MDQKYDLYEEDPEERAQNTSITETIVIHRKVSGLPVIDRLVSENIALRRKYEELARKVSELEREKPRILYFREVPLEEAEGLISEFLRKHRKARVSEIAESLELDVETVFSVLRRLKEEGKVE